MSLDFQYIHSFLIFQHHYLRCYSAPQSDLLFCCTVCLVIMHHNLLYCSASPSTSLFCSTAYPLVMQHHLSCNSVALPDLLFITICLVFLASLSALISCVTLLFCNAICFVILKHDSPCYLGSIFLFVL